MEFFGRFRVMAGTEQDFQKALEHVVQSSRKEAGCVEIRGYRSIQDRRVFYIHSRWKDEQAFELHARLDHTITFLELAGKLVDQPTDLTRAERIV
jgi:quinol monooxygenase YgiN